MTIVDGLSAALPTPLRRDGRVDLPTLDRIVDLVVEAGVDGICIGGATSEYPHFDVAERVAVIERVADRLTGDTALLVGVGAPSTSRVVELAHVAAASGARALLLPMPMFFNYEQEDLAAYCAELARRLPAPCLLYDLPDFTNALVDRHDARAPPPRAVDRRHQGQQRPCRQPDDVGAGAGTERLDASRRRRSSAASGIRRRLERRRVRPCRLLPGAPRRAGSGHP